MDMVAAMTLLTSPSRRLACLAGLVAAATLAVSLGSAERASAAAVQCPSFQVLHNDRIGKLKLRAGSYTIVIGNQRRLSCSSAADLFRQFLEDYDGVLPDGWRVQARKARFVQRSSGDAFKVRRIRGGGGGGGANGGQYPSTGRACAAPFTVQHNDQIGSLKLKAGQYRITLLAVGRLSCQRASKLFARFLQDYTGVLPGTWRLDPKTATFSKSAHYGFRVKPYQITPTGSSASRPVRSGRARLRRQDPWGDAACLSW